MLIIVLVEKSLTNTNKLFFSDVVKLEDGIGEKLATFVFYQSSFLSSIIMALVKGWKLALLCLITFPVTLGLVGIAGLVSLVYIQTQ